MKPAQIRERLVALGHTLPPAAKPVAAYVPTVRVGDLLYVSGQVPLDAGKPLATGSVPDQVGEDTAVACAVRCALNGLAAACEAVGEDGSIDGVVRVGCFVACGAGYGGQPKIANGASELMQAVFGDAGRHARAAVGAPSLPLNVPVEIEFLFRVSG